jgi:sugar phosphate isomerase/epimerase
MKFSISGRLWETKGGYRLGLLEQVGIARQLGYEGLEVRYPLLPAEGEAGAVRARLEDAGIAPTLCFCAKVPVDAASRQDALRVVRTVRALGGDAVRLAVMKGEDLPAVREFAAAAADLGARVLLHLHANTACDTAEHAIHALETVGHPNAALLADPAHLALSGEKDIPGALARLRPWIAFVNVQDFRRTGPNEPPGEVAGYDGRWTRVLPGDEGGVDWRGVLGALGGLGYRGWLNVMCATSASEDPVAVARVYRQKLGDALTARSGP